MNHYEERQEARRQRYLDRATASDQEANSRWNSHANQTLSAMGGEPIKVGHHSERRHRALFDRAHNDMRKGSEAMAKASDYRSKAAGVGQGGISSDDPDAVKKLKEQLAELERKHKFYKAVNKIVRSKPRDEVTDGKVAKLMADFDLKDATARKVFEPDFMGRIGFPSYYLSNGNANIRRVKDRISDLEKLAEMSGSEELGAGEQWGGWTMAKDFEENRVVFSSEEKPPGDIRQILKRYGFRWSPYRTAWVRKLTGNGVMNGQWVVKALLKGGA